MTETQPPTWTQPGPNPVGSDRETQPDPTWTQPGQVPSPPNPTPPPYGGGRVWVGSPEHPTSTREVGSRGWVYPDPNHPSTRDFPWVEPRRRLACTTCGAPPLAHCITKSGRVRHPPHQGRQADLDPPEADLAPDHPTPFEDDQP